MRIYPPFILLFAALLMIGLDRVAPGNSWIQAPASYGGIVPMVVGVGLVLWVNLLFRRAGTPIKPFEVSSALVVEGPFRFTRNPVYLGMVLFLFGVGVVLGSLTPFLVIPLFALVIETRFIRVEEAMLAKAFGSGYDAYRGSVRRWL